MMAAMNVTALSDLGYDEKTSFIDPMEGRYRAKSFSDGDLTGRSGDFSDSAIQEKVKFFNELDAYRNVLGVESRLEDYWKTASSGTASSTASSGTASATSGATVATPASSSASATGSSASASNSGAAASSTTSSSSAASVSTTAKTTAKPTTTTTKKADDKTKKTSTTSTKK